MASLLANPLATAAQLSSSPTQSDGVPLDLEVSLKWAGCTLIQSAGVLLKLPQTAVATAAVLFQRFYLLSSMRSFPIRDTCHASIFLSSKLTEHPVKPRDIINVTTYLLAVPSSSPISPPPPPPPSETKVVSPPPPPINPEKHYVDEHTYFVQRTRLLEVETEILKALGFQTHCSLPYTLAINYIQSLDVLSEGVVEKAFGYLTDGLLSPSTVYLTHQPNALAVAAVYLGARECAAKLPEGWWEVFDVEREELGFLVVCFKGVSEFVEGQIKGWEGRRRNGLPWDGEKLEAELERRRVLEGEMDI